MKAACGAILVPLLLTLGACKPISKAAAGFQEDADLIRLEHLQYWTQLVEEYHSIKGKYPLQDKIGGDSKIGLVKIATKQQREYLSPGSSKYKEQFDMATEAFQEFPMKDLVSELELGLARTIDEMYDIQKVPAASPIGYNYFVTDHGYAIWVPCISCGVTEISTLLYDGVTPTVNIVSDGMKDEVTKALTREEMTSHPTFKKWIEQPLKKEAYVQSLVQENIRDSKR